MTCFGTGLRKLFFVCVIAAFGVIAVSSGFGLGILLAALALVAPYKCKIPHFLPLLLILSTLVHVIAVFAVQTPLESDFAMLYQAAQKAAAGDFSFQHHGYFYRWAYQTGFVLWEAVILRVTGSMAVIKLINALFLSGINGLIYLLARRFVEERAAQAAALLYLVTLFPTLMTCVLTNQHISAFFLLLAVYVLTGGGDRAFCVRRALSAGFCLFIGNLMRPEGVVILAGLFGTALFVLIMRRSLRGNRQMLLGIVITAVVYVVCSTAASWAISASGINQYGLTNNWQEWKFILGFNHETGGHVFCRRHGDIRQIPSGGYGAGCARAGIGNRKAGGTRPHFLFSARIVVSDAGKSPKSLGLSRPGLLARLCQSRRCDMARSGRCACI